MSVHRAVVETFHSKPRTDTDAKGKVRASPKSLGLRVGLCSIRTSPIHPSVHPVMLLTQQHFRDQKSTLGVRAEYFPWSFTVWALQSQWNQMMSYFSCCHAAFWWNVCDSLWSNGQNKSTDINVMTQDGQNAWTQHRFNMKTSQTQQKLCKMEFLML